MAGACIQCGQLIAGRADRRFCSPRCRTAAHRAARNSQDVQTPQNRGDSSALAGGVGVTEWASEGNGSRTADVTPRERRGTGPIVERHANGGDFERGR